MTEQPQQPFEGYAAVKGAVRGFSRKRRVWRFVREIGLYLSVSLAAVLVWAVADWLMPLPSLAVLAGLLLAALVVGCGLIYWAAKALLRSETLHWEAVRIEQLHSGLDNLLIGALQLVEEARAGGATYSLQLVDALAHSAAEIVRREKLVRLIDRRPAVRAAGSALALVLVSALLVALVGDFIPGRIASVRSSYQDAIETIWPARMTVTPGDRTVLRNEDAVTLGVAMTGGHYKAVTLLAEDESGKVIINQQLSLVAGAASQRNAEKKLSVGTVAGVEKYFTYKFVAGRHESKSHTIRVVDRPRIENMAADLQFPSYTRMMPQQLAGLFSSIRTLKETTVSLLLAANKPLSRAALVFGGDLENQQPLEISGRFAATQFSVRTNVEAELQLVGEDGYSMKEPVRFRIEPQDDRPPEVRIVLKSDEMMFLKDEVKNFSFAYTATDDYGISQVQVFYEIEAVDKTLARGKRSGELKPSTFPQPECKMRGVIKKPFAELSVEPGDRVTFWLVAKDNNTKTGPSTGRSLARKFVVVLPNLARYSQPEFDWAQRRSLLLGSLKKVRRETDFLKLPEKRVSAEDSVPPPKHKLAAHVPPEGWPAGMEQAVTDYLQLLSTHGGE
jgi:hypothetical protein